MKLLHAFLILLVSSNVFGQWEDFNPGISGDFKDIEVYTSTKYICGNTGIFESDDYDTWVLSNSTETPADLVILERTQFYGLCHYVSGGDKIAMACGYDTVANAGVVFENSDGNWVLKHTEPGIKLLDIEKDGPSVYVVGEMGKALVRLYPYSPFVDYSYATDRTLWDIHIEDDDELIINGDSIVLIATDTYVWDSVANYRLYDAAFHLDEFYCTNENALSIYDPSDDSWLTNDRAKLPFEPKAIDTYYYLRFVGTENGIYKGGFGLTPLRFFPSSIGYSINEIVAVDGDEVYAVGDEGTMLKTANGGGTELPYVNFSNNYSVCLDSLEEFENLSYGVLDYEWYINDVYESDLEDLDYTFDTEGFYTIKLIADNGDHVDSLEKTIEVVGPPLIDLAFYTDDTILCKSGEAIIHLDTSELGVNYALYNIENESLSASVTGSGESIEISTGVISDSGQYVIRAVRGLSGCFKFFSDTIEIAVEKTKADFHVSHINAQLSQPVNLINLSEQAELFDWTIFTPDVFTSTEEDLVHSYTDLGQYDIRLIATSETGCVDTLIQPGPFVYDTTSLAENCWIDRVGGNNHDRIRDMEVNAKGDIFICGTYRQAQYISQVGIEPISDGLGGFIAKYDKFGVLQWRFECDQSESSTHSLPSGYSYPGDILDIELADDGSIYTSGWLRGGAVFRLNGKESFQVPGYEEDGDIGFVFKLDSIGQIEWHAESRHIITALSIGPSEIVYAGHMGRHYDITGADGETEYLSHPHDIFYSIFITQFDSLGHINWVTKTTQHTNEAARPFYIKADSENNINILASHEGLVENLFFSTEIDEVEYDFYSSDVGFVAQYDSSGNFKWVAEEYGGVSHTHNYIDIDSEDNVYTMTVGGALNPGVVFNKDVDGIAELKNVGKHILTKYTSSGNMLWVAGTTYGNGGGVMTIKDDHIYTSIRLSMGTDFVDSCYYRNGSETDSMGVVIVDDQNKVNYLFTKWTTDGDPLWYSYRNGPELSEYEPTSGEDRTIRVDDQGNIIFGVSVRALGDDFPPFTIAQRQITPLYQDAVLTKFSPDMCQNTISLSSAPPCEGGDVEVAFDFHAVDAENVYSLILLDDPIDPLSIDTIGTLVSGEAEGEITGTTPYLAPGLYYLQVSALHPALTSEIIEMEIVDDIPIAAVFDTVICAGEPVPYSAGDAFSYSWIPTEGVDDPTEQHIVLTPMESTTYIGELTNGCGVNHDTVTVEVLPVYSVHLDTMNLCDGDSVLVFGNYVMEAGTYIDSLATIVGCDSVLNQYINVLDLPVIDTDTIFFCESDSVFIYENYENEAGLYYDTLATVLGCDSVLSTLLIPLPTYENIFPTETICSNDSLLIFGYYQSDPGTYYDTLTTVNGCDSVLVKVLMNSPAYEVMLEDAAICAGDSILIFDTYQFDSGVYFDSLVSVDGCDSVFIQSLFVNELPLVIFNELEDDTLCPESGELILTASPTGGTFSGTGVSENVFNPAESGEGSHTLYYSFEDDNGCSTLDSVEVVVVDCLSIDEETESFLIIYPNPFIDFTTIEFGKSVESNHAIVIYNALGQEVYRNEHFTGKKLVIRKEDLGVGTFVLSFIQLDSGKVSNHRLIVQ